MGSDPFSDSRLSDEQRRRLVWELVLPAAVVAPLVALVELASPVVALWALGGTLLPIGIAGGILGTDRRAKEARSLGILGGGADPDNLTEDAKIGAHYERLTGFASSFAFMALASFFVIVVLYL